jgi:hypothetical protein
MFLLTGKQSVIYDTQLPAGIDSVQQIQLMENAVYRLKYTFITAVSFLILSCKSSSFHVEFEYKICGNSSE